MSEYRTEGITGEESDVTVTIETEGPEEQAEKVHMHTHDAAVRAMQAFVNGQLPKDCDGLGISVAWDRVLAEKAGPEEAGSDD